MIRRLKLKDFTVFKDVTLDFSSGLNVLVGENGTGKTHLLKLGFMFCNAWSQLRKGNLGIGKQRTETYLAERLTGLFKPDRLGSLSREGGCGKTYIQVETEAHKPKSVIGMPQPKIPLPESMEWALQFSDRSEKNISLEKFPDTSPVGSYSEESIYLPTKEIISFFDGFVEIAEKYNLQFDETYLDLAKNLKLPKLKQRPDLLKKQLAVLSECLGGSLVLEGGRFYLADKNRTNREITLVAEGLRKIATLLHLIENNSLKAGGTVFWDEPESNLNPRLIKVVALALCELARSRVQVVLATHNLFLMRELYILMHDKPFRDIDSQFSGLHLEENFVTVKQGKTIDDIGDIASLDEDLMQSDRYLEVE